MPDDEDTDAGQVDQLPASPVEAEVEAEACALREECQDRLWLRTITPLLALAPADESGRVAFAIDRLKIAACERAVRILGSDLAGEKA